VEAPPKKTDELNSVEKDKGDQEKILEESIKSD